MKVTFRSHLARVLGALVICGLAGVAAAAPAIFDVWVADPLEKVFPDTPVQTTATVTADAARGEHVAFQLVAATTVPVSRLRCEVSPFATESSNAAQAELRSSSVRFVGYVPVQVPAIKDTTSTGWLRSKSGLYPDPLLEQDTIDLRPGENQPVWITVRVPLDVPPGFYRSVARFSVSSPESAPVEVPLSIKVYPAKVDRVRLLTTNWFQMWRHWEGPLEKFTPHYWQILEGYARNMADHRQNCFRVEPLLLIEFSQKTSGVLEMDFSRMDRWVETFMKAGIDQRIEGLQIGWRKGPWKSPYMAQIVSFTTTGSIEKHVDAGSPEADAFYSQYFPALVKHLKGRGWLERWIQRIADEPTNDNADSYNTIAAYVRKYAPEMKTSDASKTHKVVGSIDIWVPVLSEWHSGRSFFETRRAAGEEIWFYTCCEPRKEYANRFIEQPLLKTRLLHWINYQYDAKGYLHWGYNFWTPSPYTNTVHLRPGTTLPAGDTAIVYPKPDGGVIDSIRFEAMRDGIVDHELLSQLAERNKNLADEISAGHIKDYNKYELDIVKFRESRRQLLEAVSAQTER